MSNFCPKILKYPLFFLGLLILSFFLGRSFVGPFSFRPKPVLSQGGACGNGNCQADKGETCSSCPADCGVCPTPTPAPEPTATPAPSGNGGGEPAAPAPYTGVTRYPSVTLNPLSPDPTSKTTLTFTGTASIEQGVVDLVQYSVDSTTAWLTATPTDGAFDEISEGFAFTPQLSFTEGKHTVYVRARSLSKEYTQSSNYASDTFTVVLTPPEVVLDEISPNPTKNQTPTITATAKSVLAGISKAEISLDEGETWLAAEIVGGKFSLTTELLEDGNYPVKARAFDAAGNIGESEIQILIIDTIPPIIGGSMASFGPQILSPNVYGVVQGVAGAQITMALSMKGGVTQASFIAKQQAPLITDEETFPLSAIEGTNVWSGNLTFSKEGEKLLTISAIDGAGNKTERSLNTILVEGFGVVKNKKSGEPIPDAAISVFFFDTISQTWVLWEGESYGQQNPQTTGEDGLYSFMVPTGRYYLEVKAPGFKIMQSEILESNQTTILNPTFSLTPRPEVRFNLPLFGEVILTLPWLYSPETLPVSEFTAITSTGISSKLILQQGVDVPEFSLPDRDGESINPKDFSGKKLLLTFIAFWSPHSQEQIPILDEINGSLLDNQTILGVSLQESLAATEIFMRRGGYSFDVVADKDGVTAADYKITNLPQHFFIDSSGKIQEVFVGVLGKEELLERLSILE